MADRLAGDPEWFPHPVRLIGVAVTRGETALRRPAQSALVELISGAALTMTVVTGTYCISRKIMQTAGARSPSLGHLLELILAWNCLAARNLEQEASSVADALDAEDLPRARRRLARIVGRDTNNLDTHEVCRAVIETLAESASDGIVAPLFYLALGGVPLALAYKAVNTLDSMIGHTETRYFYFGKVAARLDDAANYLPSRLTAAAMVAVSYFQGYADAQAAWKTWRRYGDKHRSPNAGQPESAMAGALHVQLGGDNTYLGELVRAPRIGTEFPQPTLHKVRSAIRLVSLVTIFAVSYGMLVAASARLLQVTRADL
jgi:adenosylcobinamide-phosphate synthase